MVSHVIYKSIDLVNLGSLSKNVKDLFEKSVHRKVLFISDDMAIKGADNYSVIVSNPGAHSQKECDIILSGNRLSLEKTQKYAEDNIAGP